MPNRFARASVGSAVQGSNAFLAPSLVLSAWEPFCAGALNAQTREGFGTIGGEWQDFLNRRFKEDLALVQRLSHSRTPDQILAAYADFWDAAAEDYGKQITTMTKLITGVMAKMIAAAQPAGDQAGTRMVPARKAA